MLANWIGDPGTILGWFEAPGRFLKTSVKRLDRFTAVAA